MTQKTVRVGKIDIANDKPFVLFGGCLLYTSPSPRDS